MNEYPKFLCFPDIVDMVTILARFSEKKLEEKVRNPETNLSKCNNIDNVMDMLIDNEEIDILKELFTPEEFEQGWGKYYMFISMGSAYCNDFDTEVIPKIRKLLEVRKKVIT